MALSKSATEIPYCFAIPNFVSEGTTSWIVVPVCGATGGRIFFSCFSFRTTSFLGSNLGVSFLVIELLFELILVGILIFCPAFKPVSANSGLALLSSSREISYCFAIPNKVSFGCTSCIFSAKATFDSVFTFIPFVV